MKKKQESIIRVGELSGLLGITIWSVRRLEERGVIPRSRRIKRGKWGWRYWPRSDLEKIKIAFSKFSDADRFLGGHKVSMDVRSNKQIVKFLRDVVLSHSVVHPEEKLSEVVVLFYLNKEEQPKDFEVFDIRHQGK